MNILRVGDPHIKVSNLEESERLMNYINECIEKYHPDSLEFLGDLFHTHAVIRVEVLEFWNKWLRKFAKIVPTKAIVGNHDQTGDFHSTEHALNVFKDIPNLMIIDKPTATGIYGYLPYIHNNEEFIKQCEELKSFGVKVLVCHATFDGSVFESGTPAPFGIDLNLAPFDIIISGHIHRRQILGNGKVLYPGTPRWDTVSDANEEKGIWLFKHDDITGKILETGFLDTKNVCVQILSLSWKEGDEMPSLPDKVRIYLELIGSSSWIEKQKKVLKHKVSLKTTITDHKDFTHRQIIGGFTEFLLHTFVTNFDRQKLLNRAKEISIV
jgi:DNA repair exonuclease SbcCD nuclease subunit